MKWLPTSSTPLRSTTAGAAAPRRSGKALREELAEAMGLPDYWLEMDTEGPGIPSTLHPLVVARSLNCSPQEVRDWPEDDVLDQLMWMDIEGRIARKHAKELERERVSRSSR